MTTALIKDVLGRYADAKNRRDVEAILALCSDDAWYESVGMEVRIEGREALRGFYTGLFAALPDYFGEFDGVAVGDDSAVVWGRFGGTTSGGFFGVEVDAGRHVELPVTFVCTFRDGLLASDAGYFDVATLAEQLGLPLGALRPSREGTTEFVERFREFWRDPDPAVVPELVAEDAVSWWPGIEGPVPGSDYPDQIAKTLDLIPDLRLEVTAHAEVCDVAFISWRARCTVGGEQLAWDGVDRFRLRDGKAVEALISYDTHPLREALAGLHTASA